MVSDKTLIIYQALAEKAKRGECSQEEINRLADIVLRLVKKIRKLKSEAP